MLAARKATALTACADLFARLQAEGAGEALRLELAVQHDRVGELDCRLANLLQEMEIYRDTCRQLADVLVTLAEPEGRMDLGVVKAALMALGGGDFGPASAILTEAAAQSSGPADEAARVAFAQGLIAEDDMRWQDAAGHYAVAARLDPDLPSLRKARALACRTGDLTAAFRLGKGLMVLAETSGTPAERAEAMRDHALTLEAQERWDEAEGMLRKALQMGRGMAGPAGAGTATGWARLSRVLEAQDRIAEAEAVMRKALEASRQSIGEAHPDYAARLVGLAGLLAAQEREAEAEPLLQKALDIIRRLNHGSHPVMVDCLTGLAALAEARERFALAEEYLSQAVSVGATLVGPTHPDHAARLFGLAEVIRAQRRLPESEALFRQALAIDRATIGEAHRDYGIGLNNLAGVIEAQGRPAEAEAIYVSALDSLRQGLGDLHPATLKVARNFGALIAAHLPHSPHRAAVEALWQAGQQDLPLPPG
jgi:tetratricopeptide (TPR) repeat protein